MPTAELTKTSLFPSPAENNAVGQTGEQLRAKVSEGLLDTLGHSMFWADTVLRSNSQARLRSLATLRSNWDSYGAPAPGECALKNAMRILGQMNTFDLATVRIVPSAEGGVGFCFSKDDRYADIESSNDGDIIGVRYVGMQHPTIIETDGSDLGIESALKEIRNHLRA